MTQHLFVVFAGASLMDIERVPEGIKVSCPGCGAVHVFSPALRQHSSAAFMHEDDCPVHARIEAARSQRRERARAAHTN